MRKKIPTLMRRVAPSTLAFFNGLRLLWAKDSYLQQTGFMRSWKAGYPCRPDGRPLPWMNYPVIAFLEERLNKSHRVFEYGSGYSTLFFASLAKEVVAVEHDRQWYTEIEKKLADNASLLHCELDYDGKYCRAITEAKGPFDLVVVDGRDRVNCMLQARLCLTENGVVILDDAQREQYLPGIHHLTASGFKRLNFEGLKPTGIAPERTTLFYRTQNCLDL